MGEQRFKVGDWVRRVQPSDWPEQYGVVGGIYKVLKVGSYGIAVTAGAGDADATSFEPWQPRVGERVKVNYGHGWNGEGEVTRYVGESAVVLMETGNFSGRVGGFNVSHLEPITEAAAPEKPATLKIEAGKFYKTRDGRKVGPMIEDKWHDRDYGWTVEHEFNAEYGKAWRADGTFHVDRSRKHSADLIAEWIDEPAAKASNDNSETLGGILQDCIGKTFTFKIKQPKFKVGDRVEITANDNYRVSFVGSFGTVKAAPTNAAAGFRVELDDGREFPFWPSEMTVRASSTPTPTIAIVALIKNGQPKPSSTPHVHASTGAAEKEAERLAAKYKGKQFGVFTLATTHEEAAPVYDHKWQNMAALGLKIDAIKELRAVAGLTLKGAKDAVEAWIEYEQAA